MRRRRLAALLLTTAVAGLIAAAIAVPVVLGIGMVVKDVANHFLTTTCDVADTTTPLRSTLYAADGKTPIAHFFTQNRSPVNLSAVPAGLVTALIDTEDRRFYSHHGVDLRGLMRAALHDVAGGGDTQGGSTLTMQYVKQVRYYQAQTDAERSAAIAPSLDRKFQNAKCALDIEKHYTKREILAKYLNIAFFGENSYGVAIAAQTYFGVSVSKLTLPQSALLVGLLQAPSQYDPFVNAEAAMTRRNQVITNLVTTGDMSSEAALRYEAAPLGLATKRPPPVPQGCSAANPNVINAGFFCAYALQWLGAHGVSQFALDNGGLKIISTLNAPLQTHGQRAIWQAGLKKTADYILVMPSVDPTTGAITSMISSRQYGLIHGDSVEPLFDAAFAGAGSTYKYFTAAAALTAGAPTSLSLTTANNTYRTKNCSTHYKVHNAGNYPDTMPLADALPQSSNTYFVALEDQFFGCHLGPVVDTALSLGMDRVRQPLNANAAGPIAREVVNSQEATFTLGQEPTSALELTSAFGAAVHDGVYCPPRPVLRILEPNGSPMHVALPACRQVLSRYVARTITTMMRNDTTHGTAASYFRGWYANGGASVAGKTGTDNNAADNANSALWFVGMTPHLVSAASLVNPDHPKQTVHGLPGLPNSYVAQDVFGAYAATYWLDAYGPALRGGWSWPSPSALPGGAVPRVIGMDQAEATTTLRHAGFKVVTFAVACGSAVPAGQVAYQEPPVAPQGSTVTICLSSSQRPYVYQPPPPPPAPPPHNPPPIRPPHRHHHG